MAKKIATASFAATMNISITVVNVVLRHGIDDLAVLGNDLDSGSESVSMPSCRLFRMRFASLSQWRRASWSSSRIGVALVFLVALSNRRRSGPGLARGGAW